MIARGGFGVGLGVDEVVELFPYITDMGFDGAAGFGAVLTGTLNNFVAYPTISANGRSTVVEAVVTLRITLTNRATGAVLFARNGAEFRERYEISIDPKAYFDESGTAMDRLSRSVARSVVSAILETF